MTAEDLGDDAMPLGDHLDELRGRLMRVTVVLVLLIVVGLVFQVRIKSAVEWPMRHCISSLVSEATLSKVGLSTAPGEALLVQLSLVEGPIQTFKLAFFFALTAVFPLLLYQGWKFVAPGLHVSERKVVFLMIPAAVIFFYAGVVLGYFFGLPYFFKWLIEFNALEQVRIDLRQSYYHSLFIMMTLCFGLVMDLPWLVLVLCKAGIVTPDQLAAKRKMILFIGIVLSAVLTPPDPVSQLMMFALMLILFESGLLAARLAYGGAGTKGKEIDVAE